MLCCGKEKTGEKGVRGGRRAGRDHFDQTGGRDHPGLHCIRKDIRENTIQLLCQEGRCHLHDPCYAGCILGSQGRDRAHGIDAIGGHGLDICLDAGASAGITSGDC